MQVSIIKDDNTVIVDGVSYAVDCSDLPADFHALQWDGTQGEIEYRISRCDHCGVRAKKGNAIITDIARYQPYVDRWKISKAAYEAEMQRLASEAAARVGTGG